MRCSKTRRLISKYQDGELGEREAREVREHLSTCAYCRREESTLRDTLTLLDAWESPEPKLGYETVLERLERRAQVRGPVLGLPVPGWAAAGLAVLSIAGGTMLGTLPGRPPSAAKPSLQQVASAIELQSFNDVLEASVGSAIATGPDAASENGGDR